MKLRLDFALCLWCVVSFSSSTNAQLLPFVDDFNDGNATDGMPGTWLPGTESGGIRDTLTQQKQNCPVSPTSLLTLNSPAIGST